ncbi:MAG TPA: VCBS repeat-containing protein [Pyrinomonadaceae bacterium]|nr:VCBS repeat-containing protein [Pyrinomonadaceae bacterium]
MFKRCGYLLAAIMLTGFSISSVLAQTTRSKPLDFYGNNLSDWVTISGYNSDGSNFVWNILRNENPSPPGPGQATIARPPWGFNQVPPSFGDFIAAFGDYNGNGTNDLVVWRPNANPAMNFYWIQPFPSGTPYLVEWGTQNEFVAGAEGDYDGDGKMDLTSIRDNGGVAQWWILNSSTNTISIFNFGDFDFLVDNFYLPGADYTGDGKDDPATIRIAGNGQVTWYVGNTNGVQISQVNWGNYNTDFIIPAGDYDGDGRADFMVWRAFGPGTNGVWYLRTNSGSIQYFYWGVPGGTAQSDFALRSGDYDGDGRTDVAVWRPTTQTFWVLRSSSANPYNNPIIQRWGNVDDVPLAGFGIY